MRKKSSSAAAVRVQEKNELSCMWGLFWFLDSHHSPVSPKLISNGRPLNKNVIDSPRKLEYLASFDAECRNIQKETELASVAVNQMFIDRKFVCKQGSCSSFKPFSDALELLNLNEDIFMETPPPRGKYYINTVCNCSPMQSRSHQDLTPALSNGKDTSFSFREIQRKLKHTFRGSNRREHCQRRSLFGEDCVCSGVDTISQKNLGKKRQVTKSNRGDDISCLNNTARKKIDFPSGKLLKKQENDVILEGKRHINSARFSDVNASISPKGQKSPSNLGRVFSTPELEFWPLSPRRDSQLFSGSAQMRYGPYNSCPSPDGKHRTCLSPLTNTEVSSYDDVYDKSDDTTEVSATDTSLSLVRGMDTMNSNDNAELPSETNSNNIKQQEEHESPVSVLDDFFTDVDNSPSIIMLQKAERRLKPRRLHFDECSLEQSTEYPPTDANKEQSHTSQYVHLVLKASCLSWDQISTIIPSSEKHLLESSLYDEVNFQSSDHFHFDRKLLFDRINEVLVEKHRSHFHSPRWLTFLKLRTGSRVQLEEVVLDEIRNETHEYFYILPRTKETTLDQLAAEDLGDSRLWIDVRTESEHAMSDISNEIMQDLILELVLGLHS